MTEKHLFKDSVPEYQPFVPENFEDLLKLQNRVLGLATKNDDCEKLMQQLCFAAEELVDNSVASVMLYNPSEENLCVHSAPSIPGEAVDALNGLLVGEGSCGNAVYHDKAMYVCNTAIDSRWSEIRSFADTFNIAACWSVPFHDDTGTIIGTFALSSFEAREATLFQRKLLDTCASIAGILLLKEKFLLQNAQLKKETSKVEKLEFIGALAGGIAHDFNNLLGIVIGNLEIVKRTATLDSETSACVLSATEASKRAANLTQRLLAFSKGGDPVKKSVNLFTVVRESIEFVLHGSGIVVTHDALCGDGDRFIADIDSGQISQVIQNITINARQAMADRGSIKVSCDTIDIYSDNARGVESGKYHKIEIHDSGPGIPEDLIDNIFDLYFTTKTEGSGLGLASSFSIVKKHGGYLYADSDKDGACFTVLLPATDAGPEIIAENEDNTSINVSKGNVLIMDDQEMLYRTVEMMLKVLGYRAVYAADGAAAVETYKKAMTGDGAIDIVIMDLTIPGGMGGKEAVTEILKIDANAKVIVSSGYSNDSVMSKYADYGFTAALSKPYNLNELEDLLSNALSS